MNGMFWEFRQQQEISDARSSAKRAADHAHKAKQAAETVQFLEQKVDKLALICRAMWELISESNNVSEEILFDKIREIDLLDGQLDGKMTVTPKKCPRCGRVMSRRHYRCLYCGTQERPDTPFELL